MCEVIYCEILIGPHTQRALKMHPVGELSSIRSIDQAFPSPPIGDYYVPSSCLLRNGYIGVGRSIYIVYVYIYIYIYIYNGCGTLHGRPTISRHYDRIMIVIREHKGSNSGAQLEPAFIVRSAASCRLFACGDHTSPQL